VISMLGLPSHDVGYVVSDLEAAVADAVARFGAAPLYVADHMEFEEVTFHELGATMASDGPGRVGHVAASWSHWLDELSAMMDIAQAV
jgi:hypothetical protein